VKGSLAAIDLPMPRIFQESLPGAKADHLAVGLSSASAVSRETSGYEGAELGSQRLTRTLGLIPAQPPRAAERISRKISAPQTIGSRARSTET
jgi:hypothetical protein